MGKRTSVHKLIGSTVYFTADDGVRGSFAVGGDGPHNTFDPAYAPAGSLALLTFCVLVLIDGKTVTGESACAQPENFDATSERKAAHDNAMQKLLALPQSKGST